jgi:hypothetical protein
MRLPRRRFLHLAAGGAALPALSRFAAAETWPARPVRIVVGFPAGNAPDIIARLIGERLAARLGQQFVVEDRPGAGSTIATEGVVNAPADGYTLMLVDAVECAQRDALHQPSLRPQTRPRRRRRPRQRAVRHDGQSGFSAQNGAGVHRLREGASGQDQHGVGGNGTSTHVFGDCSR